MNVRPGDYARHRRCPLNATTFGSTRVRCTDCGMTWIMATHGWQLIGRTSQ